MLTAINTERKLFNCNLYTCTLNGNIICNSLYRKCPFLSGRRRNCRKDKNRLSAPLHSLEAAALVAAIASYTRETLEHPLNPVNPAGLFPLF